MSRLLYLLRQSPDHISPSLFLASSFPGDVVLLHSHVSLSSLADNVEQVSTVDQNNVDRLRSQTYDELVEQIFQSDRVLVI